MATPRRIAVVVGSLRKDSLNRKMAKALAAMATYDIGKPLVIEETFPLSCNSAQLEKFLFDSHEYATGWVGHFDGDSIAEINALEKTKKMKLNQAIYREWMKLFVKLGAQFSR